MLTGSHHSIETRLRISKITKGKKKSEEWKKKISMKQLGNNNSNWKGDSVSYRGIHAWVGEQLEKTGRCQNCGSFKKLDLANISQEYKRDLSDWEWLCRSCHMTKDGRMGKRDRYGRFI